MKKRILSTVLSICLILGLSLLLGLFSAISLLF